MQIRLLGAYFCCRWFFNLPLPCAKKTCGWLSTSWVKPKKVVLITLNFDLYRLCLFSLWQGNGQNAVLAGCLNLIRVDFATEIKLASEAAMRPFDVVVAFSSVLPVFSHRLRSVYFREPRCLCVQLCNPGPQLLRRTRFHCRRCRWQASVPCPTTASRSPQRTCQVNCR